MMCMSTEDRVFQWFTVAMLVYLLATIVSLVHVSSADKAVFRIEEQVARLVEIADSDTGVTDSRNT